MVVASFGAEHESALLLALAVLFTTISFGVGQPALMASVGDAVHVDVRGVALGIATLFFMVGGSIGSAVVGGIGDVFGMPHSLLVLAAPPTARGSWRWPRCCDIPERRRSGRTDRTGQLGPSDKQVDRIRRWPTLSDAVQVPNCMSIGPLGVLIRRLSARGADPGSASLPLPPSC